MDQFIQFPSIFFRAEEGKVWTWGRGGHGQLGHNSLKTENLPKVVEEISGKKVVKVSCGGLWTAAVTGTFFCAFIIYFIQFS